MTLSIWLIITLLAVFLIWIYVKKRHTDVQKNGAIKVVHESKYKFSDTERMITGLQTKSKNEIDNTESASQESEDNSETSTENKELYHKNNDLSNSFSDSFLFRKEKKK